MRLWLIRVRQFFTLPILIREQNLLLRELIQALTQKPAASPPADVIASTLIQATRRNSLKPRRTTTTSTQESSAPRPIPQASVSYHTRAEDLAEQERRRQAAQPWRTVEGTLPNGEKVRATISPFKSALPMEIPLPTRDDYAPLMPEPALPRHPISISPTSPVLSGLTPPPAPDADAPKTDSFRSGG